MDCRWPERGLTVELDGYRYHHSRHAWEQDRRREREARARGDEFRRYTFGYVFETPELMLSELRALLGQPSYLAVAGRPQGRTVALEAASPPAPTGAEASSTPRSSTSSSKS